MLYPWTRRRCAIGSIRAGDRADGLLGARDAFLGSDPFTLVESPSGPLSESTDPRTVRRIRAIALVKKAAAFTNREIGLIEERLALRALALCAQQAPEAGLSTLLELRTRFPASPSLERVERACTQP